MRYHLGVDVGATHTRCLVVDADRQPVARHAQATPQRTTATGLAESVGRAVDAALAAGGLDPAAVDAIGIASFGPLDAARGTLTATPNLESDLHDVPLRDAVARRVPETVHTTVLNDAAAGAVAEHRLGGDDDTVAYLTLSSGIGAGVVVDGSLLEGRNGNAAEVGHFTLEPESQRRCGCGGLGHWEAFAGGENVPDYARAIADREDVPTALPLADRDLDAAAVFDAYGDDPLATEVIDRVGHWNTLGIANVVHAFAPDRIAVGGAVARNNPTLVLEPVVRSLDAHLLGDAPQIHRTAFGDDVVLLGAVHHAVARSE